MAKVDLITGFLGAGKTTFILDYAKDCIARGERVGIIENDYGAVNIDMVLLQEELGESCGLEMVIGGDGVEAHRRRLKTKLIAMGMMGYSRIIVEPSGIFDVDEFFDLLYEEPLDRWYQAGSVITLVDATLCRQTLSKDSRYILASQLADAGALVMNKCDLATEEEVAETYRLVESVLEEFGCQRKFDYVAHKPGEIDYAKLGTCGYQHHDHIKLPVLEDGAYSSVYLFDVHGHQDKLKKTIEQMFSSEVLGRIIRVKGHVHLENGVYEINATREQLTMHPVSDCNTVLIVIGENLDKEKVESLFQK